MEREYQELSKRSLKYQVAYAAGFEVMALSVAYMLIDQREYFFGEADRHVSSMWLWHLIAEIEHKNLAFDVS